MDTNTEQQYKYRWNITWMETLPSTPDSLIIHSLTYIPLTVGCLSFKFNLQSLRNVIVYLCSYSAWNDYLEHAMICWYVFYVILFLKKKFIKQISYVCKFYAFIFVYTSAYMTLMNRWAEIQSWICQTKLQLMQPKLIWLDFIVVLTMVCIVFGLMLYFLFLFGCHLYIYEY